MIAIYKKEMRRCFGGIIGYLVTCALLLLAGILTFLSHFVSGSVDFSSVVLRMEWGLLAAVPLLTMCVFATERREGTDRLIASLPISTAEILFGKFLAVLTALAIPTAVTAIYPLILNAIAEIPLVTAYAALLGYLLLGVLLLTLGVLISSLCRHEAVAGGVTLLVLLALYFLPSLASVLSWDWLVNINPFARLSGFAHGYLDLTGIFYYLSGSGICLLLTAFVLIGRRILGEGVKA